jgi:hypothetical protein
MFDEQFLVFENLSMKAIDILVEVPCFKCLFAEPIMESHLHCNPNQCTKLTEWLLLQVELDGKTKETVSMAVVHAQTQGRK